MKSFFANMNFVRGVMVLCLLAAGALGYLGYEANGQVETLRNQVKKAAPILGREIQEMAIELNELKKVESGSEFQSIQNPQRYVMEIGINPDVQVGQVNVDDKPDKSWVTGTVDKSYGVEPVDRKRAFIRAKVSNFMYLLEADSPFVVVTKAEFKQIDKVKPEDFAPDRWTFKLEITSRTPKEE